MESDYFTTTTSPPLSLLTCGKQPRVPQMADHDGSEWLGWDNHPIPPPRRVSIQADDPPLMPHPPVCCLPTATAVAHAAYPLVCPVHDAPSSLHRRVLLGWMLPVSHGWVKCLATYWRHVRKCRNGCRGQRRTHSPILLVHGIRGGGRYLATCVHASRCVSSRLQVGAYVCLHRWWCCTQAARTTLARLAT